MRAVLYARVSSDDRGKDGRNLAGQLAMCREHAERKGWTIEAELAEDERGASGADFDLPQLSRALEMASAGAFDVLVVREMDRLARGLAKQLVIEEKLKKSGVKIEYVLGEYADSPEGNLMKNVRGVVAEYERLKIIERSRRGRRLKAKGGKWPCDGHAPYGYRKEGKAGNAHLVINEPEARVVRRMYELYIGRNSPEPMSLQGIAALLTAEGVPPPNRGKAANPKYATDTWHRTTVRNILKHRRNIGQFRYGSIEVPMPELALVDEKTFKLAQGRRKQSKARAETKRKYDYLLAGYIRCSCGLHMSGFPQQHGRYLYYNCNSKSNRRHARNCEEKLIRADLADGIVWDWLKDKVMDPEGLREGLQRLQAQRDNDLLETRRELATTEELIAKTAKTIERLARALAKAEDEIEAEALQGQIRLAGQQRSALTIRQESLQAQLTQGALTQADLDAVEALASQIRRKMEDPPIERKRSLLHALGVQIQLLWKDGIRGIECISSLDLEQHKETQNRTSAGTWMPLQNVCGKSLSTTTT